MLKSHLCLRDCVARGLLSSAEENEWSQKQFTVRTARPHRLHSCIHIPNVYHAAPELVNAHRTPSDKGSFGSRIHRDHELSSNYVMLPAVPPSYDLSPSSVSSVRHWISLP